MSYQYRVFSRGITSFTKNLESFGETLSEMLNDEAVRQLTDAGWEMWRIEKFDSYQANHGFLIVLRRPVS